jgi:hypothetical protein
MNRATLVGSAVALAGAAAVALVPATSAYALKDKQIVTVTCENGTTFTATIVSVGSFQEDISGGNYQLKYAAFDDPIRGHVVIRDDLQGVDNNQTLVTCNYTGPNTGHYYTIIGFFSPPS